MSRFARGLLRLVPYRTGLALLCALGLVGAPATAAAAPPPANDDFVAAQVLTPGVPSEVASSNLGATKETAEPDHEGRAAGKSVWYSWTTPVSQAVTIETCGSEFRAIETVYTGADLGHLDRVTNEFRSHRAACAEFGADDETFLAKAGVQYWIAVDGIGEGGVSEGGIDLSIAAAIPPHNDDLAEATQLETGPPRTRADNLGATDEAGEPAPPGGPGGASVWFSWIAPKSGGAVVNGCDGSLSPIVSVYTGGTMAQLVPVAPIGNEAPCSLTFTATKGMTYEIAVDGNFDAADNVAEMDEFEVSAYVFPENDDFEAAQSLNRFDFPGPPPSGALLIGPSNFGATKQPGEPNHAGDRGGSSVWYTWQAPFTGSAAFSTCNTSFQALLAVYKGSSLDSLTPVASGRQREGACNPPASPNSPLSGEVQFNIDAGATYYVAIDGSEGESGRFNLIYAISHERLKPPLDTTAPRTRLVRRKVRRRGGLATFALRASEPDVAFSCRLDHHGYRRCGDSVTFRHLKPGRHVFRAFAIDAAGNIDPTPLVIRFRIPAPIQPHH
jgi:hypothetical protein